MAQDLVEGGIAERLVLHLAYGPPTGQCEADRRPHDARFRQRGIDAAVLPELFEQAVRGPEDTAEAPDVLAEHHHGLIARHLLAQPVVHGPDESHHRHFMAPGPSPDRAAGRAGARRRSCRRSVAGPGPAEPQPSRSPPPSRQGPPRESRRSRSRPSTPNWRRWFSKRPRHSRSRAPRSCAGST